MLLSEHLRASRYAKLLEMWALHDSIPIQFSRVTKTDSYFSHTIEEDICHALYQGLTSFRLVFTLRSETNAKIEARILATIYRNMIFNKENKRHCLYNVNWSKKVPCHFLLRQISKV